MMSNLLGQLENNEAVLLMYLAGELPEEDRAEVEQMLAADPALRASLAELAALQADVDGALGWLHPVPADLPRREAAVRRVGRAIQAAQAKPPERHDPVDEPAGRRFRPAWWAYPVAAAAALIVGLVLLTDRSRVNFPGKQLDQTADSYAQGPQIFETAQDPSIDRIERAEQEFLHPEPDLFTFDTTDLDR
jgi:hypothetical protein